MDPNDTSRRRMTRSTWVLIGFLAVAAYFLFSEHRAHFIYYLPYLLLLACPLMHLFHGHGGHGGHAAHRDDARESQREDSAPAGPPHRDEGGPR